MFSPLPSVLWLVDEPVDIASAIAPLVVAAAAKETLPLIPSLHTFNLLKCIRAPVLAAVWKFMNRFLIVLLRARAVLLQRGTAPLQSSIKRDPLNKALKSLDMHILQHRIRWPPKHCMALLVQVVVHWPPPRAQPLFYYRPVALLSVQLYNAPLELPGELSITIPLMVAQLPSPKVMCV